MATESLLDTDVAVETPEHIVFHHRLAGPARRLMALLLDLIICYVVLIGVAAVVLLGNGNGLGGRVTPTLGTGLGLFLLLLFCVQWVYFVAWEGWRGASPGKMALALRVVTTSGRPVGLAAAALRNVLRAADSLPTCYVLGGLFMAASPRFQRLGDLVAGTMVIAVERPRPAQALRLWPPLQPGEVLGEDVTLDPEERAAIELFLRRRGTLGPAREHELAASIAAVMAERHGAGPMDPVRLLALLYDRAAGHGRGEAPPSSRGSQEAPGSWR